MLSEATPSQDPDRKNSACGSVDWRQVMAGVGESVDIGLLVLGGLEVGLISNSIVIETLKERDT